jgi:Concanavalin A-like lectin/glucanases superfamily/RTX calcium-binding nonapeptide repeat (4 copies)/Right handed beta helix region
VSLRLITVSGLAVMAVFLAAGSYDARSAVTANGPQAYWKLSSTADAADAHTLTNTNSVGLNDADFPASIAGNAGSANFIDSGTTYKYLEAPDSSTLDASGGFSVTGWVKTTQVPTDFATFVTKQQKGTTDPDSQGWWIGMDSTGKLTLYLQKGDPHTANVFIQSSAAVNNGVWHPFAFTLSTTTGAALYLDGTLAASSPTVIGDISNSLPVRMGIRDTAATVGGLIYDFDGRLDEVQVYNRTLSALQVESLGTLVGADSVNQLYGFDGSGGIDCAGTDFAAFSTIQAAVDNAPTVGEPAVFACAGTYNEHVSVTKTIGVFGANSGIAGLGTRGPESIVDGTNTGTGFDVNANNVRIDGFKIRHGTPYGISLHGGTSGNIIRNSILINNTVGAYLNGSGATVTQNWFDANNDAGTHSGTAIYSDLGASTVTVTSNAFTNIGASGDAMNFASGTGGNQSTSSSSLSITNNGIGQSNLDNSGGAIRLYNTTTATISGNNSQNAQASAIVLGGSDTGITISTNTLNSAAVAGVDTIKDTGTDANIGTNSNLTATSNTITNNGTGIWLEAGSISGSASTLAFNMNTITGNTYGFKNDNDVIADGLNDWWGDQTGPSDWSTGAGDKVSQDVDFFPWSTNSSFTTFRACDKTVANPHKTLNGTNASEVLCGKAGTSNDSINGSGGNDLIIGYGGNDVITGGTGADAIIGDYDNVDGNDTLYQNDFGNNNDGFVDHIQGRGGNDVCYLQAGDLSWSC